MTVTPPAALAADPDLAAEVRRLSDRLAVTELVDRYLHSLDADQFDDEWARSMFTPDVVLTYPVGSHQGIDGVAEFTAQIMRRWAGTHHLGGNCLVDLDGDRAAVTWNLIAYHIHPGSPPPPASGHHFRLGGKFDGDVVRTPHGWRFQRLRLRITWTAGSAVTGIVSPEETVNHHTGRSTS